MALREVNGVKTVKRELLLPHDRHRERERHGGGVNEAGLLPLPLPIPAIFGNEYRL